MKMCCHYLNQTLFEVRGNYCKWCGAKYTLESQGLKE